MVFLPFSTESPIYVREAGSATARCSRDRADFGCSCDRLTKVGSNFNKLLKKQRPCRTFTGRIREQPAIFFATRRPAKKSSASDIYGDGAVVAVAPALIPIDPHHSRRAFFPSLPAICQIDIRGVPRPGHGGL
jgi:hypothetical protein